jgi:glycine/D-amino acid oxidase-like deaminating enzyme
MPSHSESYEVVVIGAGIIGCAAAKELADDHDILVLDKGQIAGEASGKASGVISFSAQRSALPEATEYALSFFPEYDGTKSFEFTPRNFVEMVPDGNEAEAQARAEAAVEQGFPLRYLDAEKARTEYPGVFDFSSHVGVLEFADTGWVDPYTLTVTFQKDAEDSGADFRMNTPVEAVLTDDGEVTGVETPDATIQADTVVAAAGWQTRPLLEGIVEVPVAPFRYQSVNLDPERTVSDDFPMSADPINGFYWRPSHNGEVHVGGGEYLVENPGDVRDGVKESYRDKVATEFPQLIQDMDRAKFTSEDTCPTGDAATPDAVPIIDAPDDAPDDLVVATGFHGYGIMESPVGGKAIRCLVTGEDCPFPIEEYSLSRFDSRDTDFELVSLAEKRSKHH